MWVCMRVYHKQAPNYFSAEILTATDDLHKGFNVIYKNLEENAGRVKKKRRVVDNY